MDEGESNSEPSESIICPKDGDEKDPLSIALPETPSSDTQTKDDHTENDQKSPSDVATPEDEADIPAQSSKTGDESSNELKKEKSPELAASAVKNDLDKDVKDAADMSAKLANLKKEDQPASDQPKSEMFIKKEPQASDDNVCIEGQTRQTNNSAAAACGATDLKVKIEIKSETKNGSSDSNQMPNEQDNNNNAENLVCKPKNLSAGPDAAEPKTSSLAATAQPPPLPLPPPSLEMGTDYSMKSSSDSVKSESVEKKEEKVDTSAPLPPSSGPPPQEHAPPGMLRHPYDPIAMMKYEMPPGAALGLDLKYHHLPLDHPARSFADAALKSQQFSADNLIKGPSHYPPMPPSINDGPIDASSHRSTPNQDSQGSNSMDKPPALPSPSQSQQPPSMPSFVGHPGLNPSQPLPANHPSFMSSSNPSLPPTSSVSSSPFIPIQGALPRPEAIQSKYSSSGSSTSTTPSTTMSMSLLSTAASAFGPGPVNPLYSSPRLLERDGLQRTPPLGSIPHHLLSHPLQLHPLSHPGLGLPHPSAHLPPHLLGGPNAPLPLMGGPHPPSNALSSLIEAAGRGTPTSLPSSISHMTPQQQHNSSVIQSPSGNTSLNSSSLSRSSPLVQGGGGAFSSHSHRPQSPSSANHPSNLSRSSPLHLSQSSGPVGPSPSVINAERERQLMRQQSPHMTPPPPSSQASSMGSSPLSSKYQGAGQPGQRPNSPSQQQQQPFRPGASPPVVRHPTMPLPMPLVQSQLMHPQSPYPPHLLHPSMFYAAHNPFNSPYPYSPYGPPPGAYSSPYLKGAGPLDGALLTHPHPTSIPPPRHDELPSPHSNGPKSVTSLQDKTKSPAPSKSQHQSNHSQHSSSSQSSQNAGPPPGHPNSSPYSSHHYPPSHAFMDNTLPPGKTSHIEALRAHAASAAGMSSSHHPTEPVHIDPSVDIEPDPEPPSPVQQMDRGPSPEAKPDDTECHRSQSAM